MATSGPGATNLVTAIADAYLDSVPIVAVTGQVASSVIGSDAFQEADIVGATMPFVKHSFLITRAEDIVPCVAEAFHIASTGRPGPVLVDIPKDVQFASGTYVGPKQVEPGRYQPVRKGDIQAITRLVGALLLEQPDEWAVQRPAT